MTISRSHGPTIRRVGAGFVTLLALTVSASPAQADEVTYQATCSVGELSAPQDFVLSGEVEAGPVDAGAPVTISGLTYSDQYGEGYRIAVTLGGTVIELGVTAGPDGGTKSTSPIEATVTAPGSGGTFAIAPSVVRLSPPGSDFEIDCPVTISPGPLGVVEVVAPATTTTTATSTSTTITDPTTPSSTTSVPAGGTAGIEAPSAVPVGGQPSFTG